MEKITLNKDTFENVRRMLASPDEANVMTGLMALEQVDFRTSTMYMVMLYKETSEKRHLWEVNCPNLLKNIDGLGLDSDISFMSIYKKLMDKISPDEEQLFLDRYSAVVGKLLQAWGFSGMIEELDIKITRKQ